MPDLDAVARFRSESRLPLLPENLALTDYNVLAISIEATRFDQTSLANPEFETTPTLVRMRDRGAYNFTRAYSPSSSTLHSMVAVWMMTYPSTVRLQTWKKAWHGRLIDTRATVAEVFSENGYTSVWVGHNHRNIFDHGIHGLGRGFSERHLTVSAEKPDPENGDRYIAQDALAVLEALHRKRERFFVWLFFESPHAPYLRHYPDTPSDEPLDLYRQELRFVDEQLARIYELLDSRGLLRSTIVLVFGDHGEEFGEHGGRHHKATLYGESIHVPLLVWLPWEKGGAIDAPTSTLYLFPWLFLRGSDSMKRAAQERLESTIGPVLRDTEGATVSELIGHDRMLSTLIYGRYKFNYDFIANLHDAFDLWSDPFERRNRFEQDEKLAALATKRMKAYREVRAHTKRFILLPKQDTVVPDR